MSTFAAPVVYIDIETIPTSDPAMVADLRNECAEILTAKTAAIEAQYKRPETVDKHLAELPSVDDLFDERWRKWSLDGATCRVISWSMLRDGDDEPDTLCDPIYREDELLARLCGRFHRDEVWPFFVAHNAQFDLRILRQRCMVHGIPLGDMFRPDVRGSYGCTMEAWAGYRGTISLGRLCKVLHVDSPKAGGMDGSKVLDMWHACRFGEISEYNAADVVATAACWRKLTFGKPGQMVQLRRPKGGDS